MHSHQMALCCSHLFRSACLFFQLIFLLCNAGRHMHSATEGTSLETYGPPQQQHGA